MNILDEKELKAIEFIFIDKPILRAPVRDLIAEVRLLRSAVSGVVNEGWVDVDRCESKMGPEVQAAILRALDD